MQKSKIRFERMNHLVTISAMLGDPIILRNMMLNRADTTFVVAFSDYVKSQIHLNMVSSIFDRNIYTYKQALDFILGRTNYCKEVALVAEYFYFDMMMFLINNMYDCQFEIEIDVENVPFKQGVTDAADEFFSFIDRLEHSDFDECYAILSKSKFAELIDYVDGLQDIMARPHSFKAVAQLFLLYKEIHNENIKD